MKKNNEKDLNSLSPRKAQVALNKWKRGLCLEKKHRYCCTITNICVCDLNISKKPGFSLATFNGIHVHAHHLFGYEQFPYLRYNKNNGILLYSTIHRDYHLYHTKTFKNSPVTANSFLSFCKKCQKDKYFLSSILTKILESLKAFLSLEHLDCFEICKHPITDERCYRIFLDIDNHAGKRVVFMPCVLLEGLKEQNLKYVYFGLSKTILKTKRQSYQIILDS